MIVFPYVRKAEFVDGDIYVCNRKIRLGFYSLEPSLLFIYPKYRKYYQYFRKRFEEVLNQHHEEALHDQQRAISSNLQHKYQKGGN